MKVFVASRRSTWTAVAMAVAVLAGSGATAAVDTAGAAQDDLVVAVDGTTNLGPTEFTATGFLHKDAVDPKLSYALKPDSWRMGGYWGEFVDTYDRARIAGAKVMWLLSDDWHYAAQNFQPWLDWDGYERFVRWTVKRHLREFPVEWYDIQNEPEYFAPSGGSRDQLLELYLRAYKAINQAYDEYLLEGGDPDVARPKIVGPSISGFKRSPIDLPGFVDFAAKNDMRLDGISWHELCSGGPPDDCPLSPHDVGTHIDKARDMIAASGPALSNAKPMVNEYPPPGIEDVPGQIAGYIAALENHEAEQANHACWYEPSGGDTCFEPRLNSLVARDGVTTRDSYWVYKAYADMVGQRLATTVPTRATTPPTPASKPFSAYATLDSATSEIRVLLGRHETRCSSAPNLYCAPVPNSAVPAPLPLSVDVKVPWEARTVTVRRQMLARPATNYAPNTKGFAFVDQVDLPVTSGVVTVPIAAFGDGESWSLVIDAPRKKGVALPALDAPMATPPTSFCAQKTCLPTGPAGSWNPTGSIYFPLARAQTAVLPDGRVVQTGGYSHNGGQHNTRVYDPATGTWSVSATMLQTRLGHSLATLGNGQVLGMAGQAYGQVLPTAELYDPATKKWRATGNLNVGRYDHATTVLRDGRVLVAGGWTRYATFNESTPTAEIYDPATQTWTPTGALTVGRAGATASLLPDGRVLLAGGTPAPGAAVPVAEIWDPATGVWSLAPSMATPRAYHTATTLADGKVLVVGGSAPASQSDGHSEESLVTATAEIYDPALGTWTSAGSLPTGPRTRHTATPLPGGRVLIAGGDGGAGAYLASTVIYDPAKASALQPQAAWSLGEPMSTTRSLHTATPLPNGNVLVAGGDETPSTLTNAESDVDLRRYEFMRTLSSAEVYVAPQPAAPVSGPAL